MWAFLRTLIATWGVKALFIALAGIVLALANRSHDWYGICRLECNTAARLLPFFCTSIFK